MAETFAEIVELARAWFERAREAGYLTREDLERFEALGTRGPADLFADQRARPLVVAFFGGTGVGKSSLLNRLAGEDIARTGAVRPTSHEVTVYVHRSVELAELPPELPVERVHVRRHHDDSRRDILWIDAPDIDSVERENRTLALAWLPHVDLLVYVVSPERYRDDVGWRVLRERGGRHTWLFVMNRWDEGRPEQRDDFTRMLREAGFGDPVVLCSSCASADTRPPEGDEFPRIEATIRAVLDKHGVEELERLGQRGRLVELRGILRAAADRLGDDDIWRRIETAADASWRKTRAALRQGFEWPIREIAGRFAVRQGGVVGRMVRQAAQLSPSGVLRGAVAVGPGQDAPAAKSAGETLALEIDGLVRPLWDDWARDKLAECLDAVEVKTRREGVAAEPLRTELERAVEEIDRTFVQEVEEHLRRVLARPGARWRRGLRRLTGFLMGFLPIGALVWVGYNVVVGYYRASMGKASFLGTDFAVSSVLLVAVVWAVPFVCDRLLRPSLERVAAGALRRGCEAALERLGETVRGAVRAACDGATELRNEWAAIDARIERMLGAAPSVGGTLAGRLLASRRASDRVEGA